jgi:molybdenum cofactor biosynthesis enzyme MoaA
VVVEAVGVADILVAGGEPAVRPELLGRTLRRRLERAAGVR